MTQMGCRGDEEKAESLMTESGKLSQQLTKHH